MEVDVDMDMGGRRAGLGMRRPKTVHSQIFRDAVKIIQMRNDKTQQASPQTPRKQKSTVNEYRVIVWISRPLILVDAIFGHEKVHRAAEFLFADMRAVDEVVLSISIVA
jgi:hypothetical protein